MCHTAGIYGIAIAHCGGCADVTGAPGCVAGGWQGVGVLGYWGGWVAGAGGIHKLICRYI